MTDTIHLDVLAEGELLDAQGFDPATGCPTFVQSSWEASVLGWELERTSDQLHNLDVQRGLDCLAQVGIDTYIDEAQAEELADQVDVEIDHCPWELIDGKRMFVAEAMIDLASADPEATLQLVRQSGPRYVPSFRGSRDRDLREQLELVDYLQATDRNAADAEEHYDPNLFEERYQPTDREAREAFERMGFYERRATVKLLVQREVHGLRHERQRRQRRWEHQQAMRARLQSPDADIRFEEQQRRSELRERIVAQRERNAELVREVLAAGPAPARAKVVAELPWPQKLNVRDLLTQVTERPGMEAWAAARPLSKLELWLETSLGKARRGERLDDRTLRFCYRAWKLAADDQALKRRIARLAEHAKAPYAARTQGMFALGFTTRQRMVLPDVTVAHVPAVTLPPKPQPVRGLGRRDLDSLDRLRQYWHNNPDPGKRAWAEKQARQILNRAR